MIDSLYIAWKYIAFNNVKTATLVACITLIAFLPVALERLLNESERQLMSRAVSTPLVVGAKGSALDLMMNTLYFDDEVPELITMEASNRVRRCWSTAHRVVSAHSRCRSPSRSVPR